MPGGDRTGPMGVGPMTGRGAGYCAGYNAPGFMNPVGGRGYARSGRGFAGGGRGWRNRYFATGVPGWGMAENFPAAAPVVPAAYPPVSTPEQERDALKQQAQYLSSSLDAIQKRLDALEKEASQ